MLSGKKPQLGHSISATIIETALQTKQKHKASDCREDGRLWLQEWPGLPTGREMRPLSLTLLVVRSYPSTSIAPLSPPPPAFLAQTG